ncbi:YcxB family protein [Paenibacillus sp. JSM ZJ436]|uniref:YcxB family protein n=1 Tax=Paenibacillus sp. JSM ZJ436 TaxID=3376190 RepID=UPI0037AAE4B9
MEVHVDLHKEDFWRFNRYVMFHMPKYRTMMLSALISVPLLSILLLRFSSFDWVYSVVVGVLIGILCDLLFVYRIKSRTMSMVKHNEGILGERTITVDRTAVHESNDKTQLRYDWSGIHDLRRDRDYLYIFVNSMQAVIIPKRSFGSPEAEQSYVKAVEDYSNKTFA